MSAVFRHELRSHFHGITAYIFMAFILAFIGIYTSLYCFKAYVVNFEYALGAGCFIFFICIPILTMRAIAEERKQKTDQLLYSLPLSMTKVVLGKYLAMVVIFTIPMLVISLYPLILKNYGNVWLPESYGTLLSFWLMGCAFIAIGMFMSSVTENQAIAAGFCFLVLIINYFLGTFANYVNTSAKASFYAVCVCIVLLAIIWWIVTKNELLAAIIGAALMAANVSLYKLKGSLFEGFFPGLLKKLSLYERFYVTVDGKLDLTALVFFVTVGGVFLFLTVQSLEKRRYN